MWKTRRRKERGKREVMEGRGGADCSILGKGGYSAKNMERGGGGGGW